MEELSEFGKKYLLLALRIDKYFEEIVRKTLPPEKRDSEQVDKYAESYFGHSELKRLVDNEPVKTPKQLLTPCISLQKTLKDQGLEEERERFLEKMIEAMKTRLEIDTGVKIPYLEQVNRLYDISPTLIDDSKFFKAKEKMEQFFPGEGPLLERTRLVLKRHEIPSDRIIPLYNIAMQLVRNRTIERFPNLLPNNEHLSIKLVKEQDWSAYNWYLGNFKSRIDVNTDIPVRWSSILGLSAHEGYPGHHTEHSIKEQLLYLQEERFEHSIILVHTPEAVLCEGIASTALDVLYGPKKKWEVALEYLCPDTSQESIEFLVERDDLYKQFRGISWNVAIYAHRDHWKEDELVKYMMQFEFYPENHCRQNVGFILNPVWNTFVFTYGYGAELITKKYGERPSPKDFTKLLTRPVLPSDLK